MYINIIEKNESIGTNSSTIIDVQDIIQMVVSFPTKIEGVEEKYFERSLEIKLRGGEEPLVFGEHPTLFRLADEDSVISETQDLRKFEYDYLCSVAPGFLLEDQEEAE